MIVSMSLGNSFTSCLSASTLFLHSIVANRNHELVSSGAVHGQLKPLQGRVGYGLAHHIGVLDGGAQHGLLQRQLRPGDLEAGHDLNGHRNAIPQPCRADAVTWSRAMGSWRRGCLHLMRRSRHSNRTYLSDTLNWVQ